MHDLKMLNRRDFLKFGLLNSFFHFMPGKSFKGITSGQGTAQKNILIIVFDALSADNLGFYQYERDTTSSISKILQKATVYHKHYAGGPFTTPGTAALLTGTYPWTSRAMRSFGKVNPELAQNNMFSVFPNFFRFAYTQNPVADILLKQFSRTIDNHISLENLYIANDWISDIFSNDYDIVNLSERQIFNPGSEIPYSTFFAKPFLRLNNLKKGKVLKEYTPEFPRGIPHHGLNNQKFFTIEKPMDWLVNNIPNVNTPFLGYFHFLPPHDPYTTRVDFYNRFLKDGIKPIKKPEHFFSRGITYDDIKYNKRLYDEYILYVDEEFGKLYKKLDETNILEDTILVFTSDHGEMFERGITGHSTAALFQPVVHIPLIIFYPGQDTRVDIHSHTSAVDLLPTLLHMSGSEIPSWCEGEILPPFRQNDLDPERNIYSVHSRNCAMGTAITEASLMLINGDHEFIHYFGYKDKGKTITFSELYDLKSDPDELINTFTSENELGARLLETLLEQLHQVDQPYK